MNRGERKEGTFIAMQSIVREWDKGSKESICVREAKVDSFHEALVHM